MLSEQSNELLIQQQNLNKHRVDKNRLLLMSVINVVTFFCAIFSMAYYKWISISFFINTKGRSKSMQKSDRRPAAYNCGPICYTLATRIICILAMNKCSKESVRQVILFAQLFSTSLTFWVSFASECFLSPCY